MRTRIVGLGWQAQEVSMIGATLGGNRIIEKLGEGGMGVVYKAHDTRLDREVAIKVLPEALAADRERRARFEREARLLAALNHPNIAAIYGLEEAEGKPYLVLELAGGLTLAERLHEGPLPVDETLDICRQIAEGLEAAHEKGIIHRDLKPANIKITPDGKVKILDFGLAKAFQGETAPAHTSKSSTLTEQMTRVGVILGTAAYMSPEQAKGRPVDKRTDIWAFVCVLYECLTGRRAFEGETVTETLAAILKGEPDWNALPASTPWIMTELLRGCLRKDPKERFHDVGDVRSLIGKALERAPRASFIEISRRSWAKFGRGADSHLQAPIAGVVSSIAGGSHEKVAPSRIVTAEEHHGGAVERAWIPLALNSVHFIATARDYKVHLSSRLVAPVADGGVREMGLQVLQNEVFPKCAEVF
jgi:serine/threonine protein kinase